MPSRSELILVVSALGLIALVVAMAAQAGYLNVLTGRQPGLWKEGYQGAQLALEKLGSELNDSTGRVAQLEGELVQSESRYESCTAYTSALTAELLNLSTALNRTTRERDDFDRLHAAALEELGEMRSNMSDVVARIELLEKANSEIGVLLSTVLNRTAEFEEAIALEGEIHRSYVWNYVTERTWSKGISSQRGSGFNRTEYLELATGPHIEDTDEESYGDLVRAPSKDLDELADFLYRGGTTDFQRVNNILKFVQYLSYVHDCGNDNYVRYPLETLIEGGGDCEDTSVLAAALMRLAGFPVVLLTVDTDNDQEIDHMMVGVSFEGGSGATHETDGVKYYVCETTSRWYVAGQLPSGYRIEKALPAG